MKCKKIERRLSDSVDGEISRKKKAVIEKHLKKCTSCKTYSEYIQKLNDEMKGLEKQGVSEAYKQDFCNRLKAKLLFPRRREKRGPFPALKQKWVFAAAGLLLVAFVTIFFLFYQLTEIQDEKLYVFSFEKAMEELSWEIRDNSELEALFNSMLLASIGELLKPLEWEDILGYEENSIFWENLPEEEMRFIESEIKKEMKS